MQVVLSPLPSASRAKGITLCHVFAAQGTRYLFQHSFMELLLYASPAPDSGEHSENRLKAGRQMEK